MAPELDADARAVRMVVATAALALTAALGVATVREVGRFGRREVVDSACGLVLPKTLACKVRPLPQSLELLPNHALMDFRVVGSL